MKKRMFHGVIRVGLLFASHLGCAQDTTTEKGKALAEIEVSRAEQPEETSRFKRDKDSERYSFYTESWAGKLPKSIGAMSSDEAADFVLKIVSDNFTSYDRQSLTWIEASPLSEQALNGPSRRVGWFVNILQGYKGAQLGHVRSMMKKAGGIHAMLNDPPSGAPQLKGEGPSVSIDVILWKVIREHGEAKPVVTTKRVKDILLKHFVTEYQYAKEKETKFTYLDLAYVPRQDNPNRWVPRWLAEVETFHPGPYPNNPMKPTIHSYVVDAWTGKIIESDRGLVPVADVVTQPLPSPPVKDSMKKTSNKPDAPDKE